MNEHQQNILSLQEAFIQQILKAKARFIHIALAAILPKELYELAAQDNQIQRCQKWATEQGYRWEERVGDGTSELLLMKGDLVCGRFRPALVGEGRSTRCVFYANVLGKPVNVTVDDKLFTGN